MKFGQLIKQARQVMFLTQGEFASELEVGISTVKRWESNKGRPNLKGMKAIKAFCEKNNIKYKPIEKEWLEYSKGCK